MKYKHFKQALLFKVDSVIYHSENIKRLDELHRVIARLKEIPDPESKD